MHIPAQSIATIKDLVLQLISINEVKDDAYIRICYTLTESGTIGTFPEHSCLSITIDPMGRKKWLKDNLQMRLKLSDLLKPPREVFPHAIKCISNYTASRIEMKHLAEKGFDMLLYTNREGFITEAPTSIIMFVKGNSIITPPLSQNILPSITRQTILDMCKQLHIPTEERSIHTSELPYFEAAFLCGTGIEIAPVQSVNDIEYSSQHNLTHHIIEEFFNLVRNIS
ncbi:MAG: aminotransferase class IV [Bacteroidia bacterium]